MKHLTDAGIITIAVRSITVCPALVVGSSAIVRAAIFSAFSELQGISAYQELIALELMKMGAFAATVRFGR
ncbi:hypothetical protein ABUE34_03585 [Kozakia baliensis]|uniref:hypothetical protein n=1 Tax=Kozakia baliensis TaxID=153496 RepID=UPI00345BB55B